MWDRISNGLNIAVKKAGGDFEIFINVVLEYIKANAAMTASCEPLAELIIVLEQSDEETQKAFLQVMEKKTNVILVYARQQWKGSKGGSK